mgnify:CR=1 FL=1
MRYELLLNRFLTEKLSIRDGHEVRAYAAREARNEQAMVHQSVGYARMHRRRGTFASAASVGPGATNLLTGAALATTNRLPALLLQDTKNMMMCACWPLRWLAFFLFYWQH